LSEIAIPDKIRQWGEDDSVIFCERTMPMDADARCELCTHPIAALAASRRKAALPGWHLVCRECLNRFFPDMKKRAGEVKFCGRFRTDEGAEKVLPK
jgi:hypothetical protein